MRQCGYGYWVLGIVAALQLSGCYKIKKWDLTEGRENIYSEDPTKEKTKSAHPIRGVIKVDLAIPKHMACVLESMDGTEGFDGQKVCQMQPINGKDLNNAWKNMYLQAEGNKLKAGYIAMNVGEVLQTELKASLEQYFFAAEVKLVDQPGAVKEQAHNDQDVKELVSPDNHRAITAINDAKLSGKDEDHRPTMAPKAGMHIPFTVNSVPVFLYVPTEDDRVSQRVMADAIRVTTADLAKKLIEYQDEAARSARRGKKARSISVVF